MDAEGEEGLSPNKHQVPASLARQVLGTAWGAERARLPGAHNLGGVGGEISSRGNDKTWVIERRTRARGPKGNGAGRGEPAGRCGGGARAREPVGEKGRCWQNTGSQEDCARPPQPHLKFWTLSRGLWEASAEF